MYEPPLHTYIHTMYVCLHCLYTAYTANIGNLEQPIHTHNFTDTDTSDVTDTKFCVCSPQVFFICDTTLHCKVVTKNLHHTALQSCYQKLAPHRAALQIIYLNSKFLDIFSFF